MKKYYLLLAAVFSGIFTYAQLTVDGNSEIFSQGTHIYVEEEVTINSGAEIFMRDGANFVQGNDAAQNGGDGEFSIFQEGTADQYIYNYWCSPVGVPAASVGNQNFTIGTSIQYPLLNGDTDTDHSTLAASASVLPTSFNDGQTDDGTINEALQIAGRWLYTNRNDGTYSGWQRANTTAIEPGIGFTMKGVIGDVATDPNIVSNGSRSPGQRYDFRGRPNNGTIDVEVAFDSYTLTGNPYPSTLDTKQFLLDNAGEITQELLYWEQVSTGSHRIQDYQGGYGLYVPGTAGMGNGTYTPATYYNFDNDGNYDGTTGSSSSISPPLNRRYAAIGQGFYINRDATDFTSGTGTATFSNSQRVAIYEEDLTGDAYFKRGSNNGPPNQIGSTYVRPKIRLNVRFNDTFVRQMVLQFGVGATDAYDIGLEGRNTALKGPTDAYMPLGNEELVIQSVPFALDKKVPVGLEIGQANTNVKINVGVLENFDTPEIMIHDKLNDTYHDIKDGVFEIDLPAGTLDDRLEIVFEQTTLSNPSVDAEQFRVFQNNASQLLTVQNPNLEDVSNIAVYDLSGRLVVEASDLKTESSYTFETTNFSNGIYIVKVTDATNEETSVKVPVVK